jgi:uncharacterized repeat protein (TIGR01451 family)
MPTQVVSPVRDEETTVVTESGDTGPPRARVGTSVAGALVVAIAVVLVIEPGLAPTFDLAVVLEYLMALIGIGAALVYGFSYLRGEGVELDPPLIEYRSTVEVPGESIDAKLVGADGERPLGRYKRLSAVRERLRALLEGVLLRTGVPEPGVEEAIGSGEWTDDSIAAGFFEGRSPFSAADRIRLRLRRSRPLQVRAYHAIDALADRLGIDDREWNDPDEPGDLSAIEEGWVGRLEDVELGDRSTDRWRVVAALTLLSVGFGVLLNVGELVLAGVVGLGPLAFKYVSSPPTPKVAVERDLDDDDPDPGQGVRVTVTVTNVGDGMLSDLRYLDGVPPGLRVVDGSPRHGTALQPGASMRFAYVLTADRGEHVFERSLVVTRDASGGVERTGRVEVSGAGSLRCEPKPTSELTVPVRSQTSRDVGRVVTDTGGNGLEFHSVREYRPGDPLKRIDWNRLARGGELATMQFREEHAATVVLLLDARNEAFVAPERDAPSAIERSLGAAAEVFRSRLDSDDRVGLAALAAEDCWLPPGSGHGHWPLARQLLATDSAFTESDGGRFYPLIAMRRLRKRLPKNAQLILFSPLADDTAVGMARRLHAYGYPMTVVTPDATMTDSPGRTVAHIERQLRLSRLRDADVRVIDWKRDEPLGIAVNRATRRWSR